MSTAWCVALRRLSLATTHQVPYSSIQSSGFQNDQTRSRNASATTAATIGSVLRARSGSTLCASMTARRSGSASITARASPASRPLGEQREVAHDLAREAHRRLELARQA